MTPTRNILIICFILSALFTTSGISIRMGNESQNKSLVPVLDFYECVDASRSENVQIGDVLRRFKEIGVSTIAVEELAAGFEQKDLDYIKSMGFQILLRPSITAKAGVDYYEDIVKRYNVRYIIFNNKDTPNDLNNQSAFEGIVKKYKLVIGIIENASQTGYVEQPGLSKLIYNTDYSISRVYIVPDSDLTKISGSEMFYRWLRSSVDRNIRFIYIRPLKNNRLDLDGNIKETINSVAEFNKFVSLSGFSINAPINVLSSQMPPEYHKYAVALSLMFAFLLYIFYLFKPKIRTILVTAFFTSVTIVFFNILLGDSILRLWAVVAAILYPSVSSLIFLIYLKSNFKKALLEQTLTSLGILLGINALGMYTVVTAMGDLRFSLGMIIYMGVTVSFIIPVVLFAINYFGCFIGFENVKGVMKKLRAFKITAKGLVLFLIFGFIFYVYVARSGNDMGISATKFELNFRELLEKFLLVRPRFKEFLIGYPTLLLLIYLYKRFKKKEIVLILGFFVTMGSVSMVNSFCHGFTPVLTSFHRTVNGLLVGIPLGLILIFLVRTAIIFYNKIIRHYHYADK